MAEFYERIRALNDLLRTTLDVRHGNIVLSRRASAVALDLRLELLEAVRIHEGRGGDDDLHDAGSVLVGGTDFHWRIRYRDRSDPKFRADRVDDHEATLRILKIALAKEM